MTEVSDWAEAGAALLAAITFIFKVAQDHTAFRHKQAESARSVVAEIYRTKASMDALNMLDYDALHYQTEQLAKIYLTKKAVIEGLRVADTSVLTTADVFVRESFDELLLGLEQIKGFLDVKYILWEDVEATLGYYIDLVRRDNDLRLAFITYAKKLWVSRCKRGFRKSIYVLGSSVSRRDRRHGRNAASNDSRTMGIASRSELYICPARFAASPIWCAQ